MAHPFDVETIVVCDFVRHESNGKDILIGVYGSGIRVEALPTSIPLSIWIEAKPHKPGTFPVKLRILGPNEVVILSLPVTHITFPNEKNSNMTVPPLLLTFQSVGDVRFKLLATMKNGPQ